MWLLIVASLLPCIYVSSRLAVVSVISMIIMM
jgi:hypothetical protein